MAGCGVGARQLRDGRRVNALRASSACASPLAGDTPAVPPLKEQLWALRPYLDGGVQAVDVFTPDARGTGGRVGLVCVVARAQQRP